MHILIVDNSTIPTLLYGGTSRVIWYLGKELSRLGHKVSYLVKKGSHCDFANIIEIDHHRELSLQIPDDVDIVHYNSITPDIKNTAKPYVITIHRNLKSYQDNILDKNSIFISQNHASRYGSECYVYNGLDWDDYSPFKSDVKKSHFHFLGKAAWKVKNVKGAIHTVKQTKKEKLVVLGGYRLNLKMGFRFTLSPRVKFAGMVGGKKKDTLLQTSKGLVCPVLWQEPFGLTIIESLYFGCPVFGTPYGSLPEIVGDEYGFLSNNSKEMSRAIENSEIYSSQKCHDYAVENFNSKKMALGYLEKYDLVIKGNSLNKKAPERDFSTVNGMEAWVN